MLCKWSSPTLSKSKKEKRLWKIIMIFLGAWDSYTYNMLLEGEVHTFTLVTYSITYKRTYSVPTGCCLFFLFHFISFAPKERGNGIFKLANCATPWGASMLLSFQLFIFWQFRFRSFSQIGANIAFFLFFNYKFWCSDYTFDIRFWMACLCILV